MLYIYLKKNEAFENAKKENGTSFSFLEKYVYDHDFAPRIELKDYAPEALILSSELKETFLKATEIFNINSKVIDTSRKTGIYKYGKASCMIILTADHFYNMFFETFELEGVVDMKILMQKILEGSLLPSIPFGNAQKEVHLLDILKEILSEKKLSPLKKFFFALRLLKK